MKCRVLRTYLSGACVRQVNVWPQSALFNIRFRVYIVVACVQRRKIVQTMRTDILWAFIILSGVRLRLA